MIEDFGPESPEEAHEPVHAVDGEGGGPHTDHPAGLQPAEDVGLLRVEESLADVQGHGEEGGQTPGHGPREPVGPRLVLLVGICYLLHFLVHHKVNNLEGEAHGEHGGVGSVEGRDAFVPVDGPGTGESLPVRGAAHLHPLLDDCKQEDYLLTTADQSHRQREPSLRRGRQWRLHPRKCLIS